MTDAAIIQGSLVDVRNVNQHKCVRMLIDVPAELAPKVMEAFGWPTMANPVPVAVAHLQEPAKQTAEKPKRSWPDMPRSQQAGIASNDEHFEQYLIYRGMIGQQETVADAIRRICGVKTRAALDNTVAGEVWDTLYSGYQLHRRGAAA